MAKSTVYYDYSDRVVANLRNKAIIANRLILDQIHANANKITPMKSSMLRTHVDKVVNDWDATIIWQEPYASYQERGMRRDGTHVVRNYTTPGTGKEYAKRAVKQTIENGGIAKYFKNLL